METMEAKEDVMAQGLNQEVKKIGIRHNLRVGKMQEVIGAALIRKESLRFRINEELKSQSLKYFTQVMHSWYRKHQSKLKCAGANSSNLKDLVFKKSREHWNHVKAVNLGNQLFSFVFADLFIHLVSSQSVEPDIFLYIEVCCDLLRATTQFDQTKSLPLVLTASLVKHNRLREFCKEFVECLSGRQIVFELAATSKSVAKSKETGKATSKYIRDPKRAVNQQQNVLRWLQQLSELLKTRVSDEERQQRIDMFTRWCASNQMCQARPRLPDNTTTTRPIVPTSAGIYNIDPTRVGHATSVENLPSISPFMSSMHGAQSVHQHHYGSSQSAAQRMVPAPDVAFTIGRASLAHAGPHYHSLSNSGGAVPPQFLNSAHVASIAPPLPPMHSLPFPNPMPSMHFAHPCPCGCYNVPYSSHPSGPVPQLFGNFAHAPHVAPPMPPLPIMPEFTNPPARVWTTNDNMPQQAPHIQSAQMDIPPGTGPSANALQNLYNVDLMGDTNMNASTAAPYSEAGHGYTGLYDEWYGRDVTGMQTWSPPNPNDM